MNSKNLLWSAIILGVLIAIIVVSNVVSAKRPRAESGKFFPGITAAQLSAFQVTDKEGSVKIFRKGDVWMATSIAKAKTADSAEAKTAAAVPGADTASAPSSAPSKEYTVDSASVASAIEKLTTMQKDVLISENIDKQAIFEVDNEKGMTVQAWDTKGKDLGTVIIGKSGPDWSSHYVRPQGSNKVYSCGGSIRYAFFSDLKRWRDKSVVKFDKASAKKIVIQKQALTVDLEKETDTASNVTWKLAGSGDKAKTDEVNKILDELSKLNCTDWAADTESVDSMGFAKPEAVITAIMENGNRKIVTIGAKKTNTSLYYVKVDGKEEVYMVPDWIISKFDAKPETLKEAPPAPETTDNEKPKKNKGKSKG